MIFNPYLEKEEFKKIITEITPTEIKQEIMDNKENFENKTIDEQKKFKKSIDKKFRNYLVKNKLNYDQLSNPALTFIYINSCYDAIEKFPLIWNKQQEVYLQLLVKQHEHDLKESELEILKKLIKSLNSDEFKTVRQFKVQFAKDFGGKFQIKGEKERFSDLPETKFFTEKVNFMEKDVAKYVIFLSRLTDICLGAVPKKISRRGGEKIRFTLPFLTGDWKEIRANHVKDAFNEIMRQYYHELLELSPRSDVEGGHLFALPSINFGIQDMSWKRIGGGMQLGVFSRKSQNANTIYAIGIFELLIFLYHHLGIKNGFYHVVHHEITHMIEDRYIRMWDMSEKYPENPNYKEGCDLYPIKPNNPEKFVISEGRLVKLNKYYNNAINTLKYLDKPLSHEDFKGQRMQLYTNKFGGHDHAFLDATLNFSDHFDCKQSFRDHQLITFFFRNLYWKKFGKNFRPAKWYSCHRQLPILAERNIASGY